METTKTTYYFLLQIDSGKVFGVSLPPSYQVSGTRKLYPHKHQAFESLTMRLDDHYYAKVDWAFYNIKGILGHKNQNEKSYSHKTEAGIFDYNKTKMFLIFSSEKKAMYVAKHLVVPTLLKEVTQEAEEVHSKYLKLVDEIGTLENMYKDCNIDLSKIV